MGKNEIGMLAESRSGHDRGQIYVIIKAETEYVYLSDGRLRTLDKLKKKNRKHIQIIRKPVQGLSERLQNGEKVYDEEIKRAIKLFKREIADECSDIGGKQKCQRQM